MKNDFESELQRQPMRQLPPEWRGEILEAANRATAGNRTAPEPARVRWWEALIWPAPRAWAAVGAAWVMIIGLNVITPDSEPLPATPPGHAALNPIRALKERERLTALLTQDEYVMAQPEPPAVTKPRSERRTSVSFA